MQFLHLLWNSLIPFTLYWAYFVLGASAICVFRPIGPHKYINETNRHMMPLLTESMAPGRVLCSLLRFYPKTSGFFREKSRFCHVSPPGPDKCLCWHVSLEGSSSFSLCPGSRQEDSLGPPLSLKVCCQHSVETLGHLGSWESTVRISSLQWLGFKSVQEFTEGT
jgi:hypothetical protein